MLRPAGLIRRRETAWVHEPPAELRTFTPGSLRGASIWAAFGVWRDLRVAYGNAHGWPGGMDALHLQHMGVRRRLQQVERSEPGQSA